MTEQKKKTKSEPFPVGLITGGIKIISKAAWNNWSKKLMDATYGVEYGCGHTGTETHRKIQSMARYKVPRMCNPCKRAESRQLSQKEEFLRARFHSDVPSLSAKQWPAPPSATGNGDSGG